MGDHSSVVRFAVSNFRWSQAAKRLLAYACCGESGVLAPSPRYLIHMDEIG